jgi:hypothetical protein
MLMHCETGQVRANLTKDRVGGDRADAGHIREIDAENPIKFTPEIQDSRFVMLPSVLGLLRLWGQR